ncbi:MAG: ankyrin repeat domain-containing protein [Verrucomicrobia bacterium]|nr:ankyrin repeat domain-containing protein [Verrucomicrobiota bacterium]
MKTPLAILFITTLLTAPRAASAAEPAGGGLLQKGLYEEEANHNLKAAIEAYQALVTQFDAQRAATATAVFRLGECYRKQGKTNEAAAFYQRILRDFADQTELARLSRTFAPPQVAAKGTGGESEADKQKRAEIQTRVNDLQETVSSLNARMDQATAQQATALKELYEARKLLDEANTYPPYALPIQTETEQFRVWKQAYAREAIVQPTTDEEKKNHEAQLQYLRDQLRHWINELHIPKLKAALNLAENRVNQAEQILAELRTQRKKYQNELAAEQTKLSALSAAVEGGNESRNLSPASQQRKELIEEEIRLVEQQLQSERRKVDNGTAPPDNLIKFQREILALKRELLAIKPDKDILDIQVPPKTNALASAVPANSEPAPESAAPATDDEAKELQRIKAIIKDSPDLVNAPDRGFTPLQRAANNGHLVVAEFLLANKADINGSTGNRVGATPLHFAAWSGHKSMVELLIAHGADVNALGDPGDMKELNLKGFMRTPLHVAVEQGHKLLTQVMLANKADVNAKAARRPNDYSKDPNEWPGATPLFYAVAFGRKDLVELLVAAGADVNARNDRDRTPIFLALEATRRPVLNWLLENKAEVNVVDDNGWTPLHQAIRNESTELAEVLLKAGADPNLKLKDASKFAPLMLVALDTEAVKMRGDLTLLELLRSHGADVNAQYANGMTAIWLAYVNRYEAAAEWLLKQDADVNLTPSKENTLLQRAAQNGNRPFVEALLAHKANINAQNAEGSTALHSAVNGNQVEIVKLLLAHQADATLKNTNGQTPLDLANTPGQGGLGPGQGRPAREEIRRLLTKPAQ